VGRVPAPKPSMNKPFGWRSLPTCVMLRSIVMPK
jgi:hypothetical protein